MKYITKDEFDEFIIFNNINTNFVSLYYNLNKINSFDYDLKFNMKNIFSRYMITYDDEILLFYKNTIYSFKNDNILIKYMNNSYIMYSNLYRFKSYKSIRFMYNLSGKLLSKIMYSIKKNIRYYKSNISLNYKIIFTLNYTNNMISYIRHSNNVGFVSIYNYRLYII